MCGIWYMYPVTLRTDIRSITLLSTQQITLKGHCYNHLWRSLQAKPTEQRLLLTPQGKEDLEKALPGAETWSAQPIRGLDYVHAIIPGSPPDRQEEPLRRW
jgi:hypothetical protein